MTKIEKMKGLKVLNALKKHKKMGISVICPICKDEKVLYNKQNYFLHCHTRHLVKPNLKPLPNALQEISNENPPVKQVQPITEPETSKVLQIEKVPEIKKAEENIKDFKYRCGKCNSPFNDLLIENNGIFCPICKNELNKP